MQINNTVQNVMLSLPKGVSYLDKRLHHIFWEIRMTLMSRQYIGTLFSCLKTSLMLTVSRQINANVWAFKCGCSAQSLAIRFIDTDMRY